MTIPVQRRRPNRHRSGVGACRRPSHRYSTEYSAVSLSSLAGAGVAATAAAPAAAYFLRGVCGLHLLRTCIGADTVTAP